MSNGVYSPPNKRKKRFRRLIGAFFLLLFLGAAILAGGAYFIWDKASTAKNENSTEEVAVSVPLGSSLSSISQTLEDSGIVDSALLFKYYVQSKGEGDFQAGDYTLSPSMTPDELIASLKEGKVVQQAEGVIVVPEGYQLTQIADSIAAATGKTPEEVLAVLNDPAFVEAMMTAYPALLTDAILADNVRYPLEGYLFPATYELLDPNKPVEAIAEEMIAKTAQVVEGYMPQIQESGMSVHEFLTFSSLVEEEATGKTDRKKIASVFYNRLNVDMPLQTDPTVLYAQGQHKDRVLYEDLETDSPYNTYQVKGLTPGPIGNSGTDSMEAVLAPEQTEYLYFLASKEGDVYYSKTLDEHNRLKAKYITNAN